MNCTIAKKISIVDFLARQGFHPKNNKTGSVWYCSPLRNENDPSFKVNLNKNIWYDFGIGEGGGIIDLVMRLHNTNIPGALQILQDPVSGPLQYFVPQKPVPESKIKIEKLKPLNHNALLQYLNERRISQANASSFIQEACYSINEKNYFALAFQNDKGGCELRNKYFKGSSSPKAITTIKGFSKAVNIFEGFMDFLSALEYYNLSKPANTTIILNSVTNLESIFEKFPKNKRIHLYLDNDNAGKRATNRVESKYNNVKNYAEIIYPEFKDMNDFIQNTGVSGLE